MCKKPYRKGNLSFGCGQCTHCRINRVRVWVGRMMLESSYHPASTFVTLTYNDEHLPNPPYVSKKAVQLFLYKLRAYAPDRKFRYYAVGEYGEKSWRPHYHLIIYGLYPTETALIEKCWPFGFVKLGTVENDSCSYVASYLIKRMTKKADPRLEGRPPEFSLMSLKPGIGHRIVDSIERNYDNDRGDAALKKTLAPPNTIRLGENGVYPLGAYLSSKVADRLGYTKADKKLLTSERSYILFQKQQGRTVTSIESERLSKLSQQNSKVRIKRRYL
ncbi:MAG: replication initiator protein [Microviridae sp.]|nr:MAG: replication initiator protein [Microviridae sp.]